MYIYIISSEMEVYTWVESIGRVEVGIFLYFWLRLISWCWAGQDLGTHKGGNNRDGKTGLGIALPRRGDENL